jgi:hypothetical protein
MKRKESIKIWSCQPENPLDINFGLVTIHDKEYFPPANPANGSAIGGRGEGWEEWMT